MKLSEFLPTKGAQLIATDGRFDIYLQKGKSRATIRKVNNAVIIVAGPSKEVSEILQKFGGS